MRMVSKRLLFEVVRLLGVQREDLEGDIGIGNEERDDGLGAQLAQRLKPVIPVRGPVPVALTNHDDRIEEAAEGFYHIHQAA